MAEADIVEDAAIKLNITEADAVLYGSTLTITGAVILVATGALVVYTIITASPENMKPCEKLIIYNVLVPDMVLGLLLFRLLGPNITESIWDHSRFVTHWVAYLHAFCVFHPHLALAYICKIISVSLSDVYRFESANTMKHMSMLVLSTTTLTVCFCSLPSVDRKGYIFRPSWLGPWFNVSYQYGSVIMVAAFIAVILPLHILTIIQMFEAKTIMAAQGQSVTKRALEDLYKLIVFCLLSALSFLIVIPAAILDQNVLIVMVVRMAAYMCPIIRVLSLKFICPHFHFGRATFADQDIDDLAKLGGSGREQTTGGLEDIIAGTS